MFELAIEEAKQPEDYWVPTLGKLLTGKALATYREISPGATSSALVIMVQCDNDKCTIQWFHFDCLRIRCPPKGKWYCPSCRKLPKFSMKMKKT